MEIIISALLAVVVGYVLFDIKRLKCKVDKCNTYEEMERYYKLKDEVNQVRLRELKEDTQEIKAKLDRLIEKR